MIVIQLIWTVIQCEQVLVCSFPPLAMDPGRLIRSSASLAVVFPIAGGSWRRAELCCAPTREGKLVCGESVDLFRLVDDALCNYVERLSKEVKLRLADFFDLYFPCRCRRPFIDVNRWTLDAWRVHYNHTRHDLALGRPPCGEVDNPE